MIVVINQDVLNEKINLEPAQMNVDVPYHPEDLPMTVVEPNYPEPEDVTMTVVEPNHPENFPMIVAEPNHEAAPAIVFGEPEKGRNLQPNEISIVGLGSANISNLTAR